MYIRVSRDGNRLKVDSDDQFLSSNASRYISNGYILDISNISKTLDTLASTYDVKIAPEDVGFIISLENTEQPVDTELNLFDFQKRGLNFAKGKQSLLFNWSTGTGKAQPLTSKVLTPTGFVAMGDIKKGMSVIARDGNSYRVTGVYPQGVKEVYQLTFKDGSTVECCGEHLWLHRTASEKTHRKPYQVSSLDDIAKTPLKSNNGYDVRMPINQPVEFVGNDELEVDPYLLGVLLGDGCLTGSSIEVSTSEHEIVESIARILPNYDIKRGHKDNYSYSLTYKEHKNKNPLKDDLRTLGLLDCLSGQKFIPAKYLMANVATRRQVLTGLFDTDGSVAENGTFSFSTVSEQLKNDFVFLCRSLGYRTVVSVDDWRGRIKRVKQGRYEGRCYETKNIGYSVRILTSDTIFSTTKHKERFNNHVLGRKRHNIHTYSDNCLISIEPIGEKECQCISVDSPDSTYLTDNFLVTHNTIVGVMLAKINSDADRILIFTPNKEIGWQWKNKLDKFTELTSTVIQPTWPVAKREKFYANDKSNIWIMNYERLRTADFDFIMDEIKGKQCVFMYDEMQRLRNRKTQMHKKFKKMVTTVKPIQYGFSATPVEKRPDDLFNIFTILDSSRFGRVKDFERDFTYMNGAKDMWGAYIGYENITGMRARVSDLIHSVDKNDEEIAKEFPETVETKIELELDKDDRAVYNKTRELIRELLNQESDPVEQRAIMGIGAMVLRGLCQVPYVMYDSLYNSDSYYIREIAEKCLKGLPKKTNAKIDMVKMLVEDIAEQGEKAIIFATLTNNALLPLAEHLSEYSPLMFYGGNKKTRGEEIEQFKTTDRPLLLASDAGREGLDIPEAAYVINFNTPVHYSWYTQRVNRVSRIVSKKETVFAYRFVTKDTIEERVEEVMSERRELSAELGLGGEYDDDAEVLNKHDMMYLLFGDE